MRLCYIMPDPYFWRQKNVNGTVETVRALLPWGRESFSTSKIRQRLAEYPSSGSGPFFGANADPSAHLDRVRAGQDSAGPIWYLYQGIWEGYHKIVSTYRHEWTYCINRGYAVYWITYYQPNLFGRPNMGWQVTGTFFTHMGIDTQSERYERYSFNLQGRIGDRAPNIQQICDDVYRHAFYGKGREEDLPAYAPSSHSYISTVEKTYRPPYNKLSSVWHNYPKHNAFEGLFRYDEYDVALALVGGYCTNEIYSGLSAAFDDAAQNMPAVTVNTAANILDIINLLKNLVSGVGNIPKTARDIWLWYRYVFNTSKSDLREYADLTARLTQLIGQPKITVNGSFRDDQRLYNCAIVVSQDTFLPKDTADWLHRYGLRLTATNYWDMIPYSFVVDWFFNIGKILEYLERYQDSVAFREAECWYSIKTEYDGINTYTRVMGSVVPRFPPRITFHKAGSRTLSMRIVDGLCLFCYGG